MCTQKCAHVCTFLLQTGALRDICGICEMGLLSCSDLKYRYGNRIVIPVMDTRVIYPISITCAHGFVLRCSLALYYHFNGPVWFFVYAIICRSSSSNTVLPCKTNQHQPQQHTTKHELCMKSWNAFHWINILISPVIILPHSNIGTIAAGIYTQCYHCPSICDTILAYQVLITFCVIQNQRVSNNSQQIQQPK